MDDANLTKGMEHLRPYVSVASPPPPQQREQQKQESPSSSTSPPLSKPSSQTGRQAPSSQAPSAPRSRSESNPNHRADPSKFGSRYLQEGDDIFEFNAWDSVPLTQEFLEFAEQQYSHQRSHPVSDFDKQRFNDSPEKWWDRFYANNSSKFFKDRNWLLKEFPVLQDAVSKDAGPLTVLEVGCGAGNTAFPLLEKSENEQLMVHCCDFSKKAVDVVKDNKMFDEKRMRADVWDLASVDRATGSDEISLPPGLAENSVDIVILIFVLSALSPSQWTQALRNINSILKPGGQILFRDYARGDLAQVRFKKGRWMEENFYVRGDGTRVYFFDKEEVAGIFGGFRSDSTQAESDYDAEGVRAASGQSNPVFDILDLGIDRRMLVNRQRKLKMFRCWMQGHFIKLKGEARGKNGKQATVVQD